MSNTSINREKMNVEFANVSKCYVKRIILPSEKKSDILKIYLKNSALSQVL